MKRFFLIAFILAIAFSQYESKGQTWLTNHSTLEEIDFWKARAGLIAGTPLYRHTGDAGKANSPGDWDRIVANKNVWTSNPAVDRYTNYFKGCSTCQFPRADLAHNINLNDTDDAYYIISAAFYAHLTNNATIKTQIRNEIMNHVVNEKYSYNGEIINAFDFWNVRRWSSNTFQDINPGFGIADWVVRILYAYQWSSAQGTAWSDADKSAFNNWVKGAGYFLKTNYDIDANALFTNRAAKNYTPVGTAKSKEADLSDRAITYIDGSAARHYARYISRHYSNRRLSIAGAVGEIGVHLRDPVLISSAKVFCQETIRFSIYPDGTYCDFLRQTAATATKPAQPQKGFSYTHSGMMHVFMLADALARIGDRELIDYETTEGTTGTDGSSDGVTKKGIKMHILAMCKLWQHQNPVMYGTESVALATGATKHNYLIDGSDEEHGDKAVWYVYWAGLNVYYKNSTIRDVYLQDASGVEGYPSNPQTIGARNAYTGANLPGWLLMFGQREASGPNPYPGNIGLQQQTITFQAIPDKTYGDGSFSITATAPGGTVTFSSSDVTKATVSGNTVTIKGAGDVAIYANQGGNATYAKAPQTSQSFTIAKKALTFTVANATRVYNKTTTFSGTYSAFAYGESASVLTTQPTITTTATQTSNVGTYAITASNGSALNYALSYLPGTLTITKGTVTLAVGADLNKLTTDSPFNLNVVAYEQGTTNVVTGLPIGYAKQSGTSVTSVSSVGLVTLSGTTGTSTLLLTVSVNTNYFQVTNIFKDVVVSLASKTAQSIAFSALSAKTYGDAPSSLSATGGSSGNPVVFTSSDPGVATTTGTNGTTLTIVKAGIVNIKANQAGNSSFEDAPEFIRPLTINPKNLQVSADNKTRVYGAENPGFTISYSGFVSGENSSNLTAEPIATTAATITSNVGNYAIVPSGGSALNYAFTYVNGQLSITQASQSITFPSISDKGDTEVPFQLNATASSGLAVTYTVVSGPATVTSSGLVTLSGASGLVTIRAAQVGNINYSAASTVDQSFSVIGAAPQQAQIIAVIDPGTKVYSPGATFTFVATANSGLTVTNSLVSGPATMLGNVVTITGAGSIVLKSVQAGNGDYFPASDVYTTVIVNKANQSITSATIPDKYLSDPTFSVTATASSGLSVTLTANNKLTQNTATTFTPLALGQAIITVSQAGNANYNPVTLYLTFNIVPAPVTGTVDILDGRVIYSGAYTLGSGSATYWLYNLIWPSLAGTYTTTRFVLSSGHDANNNVVTGNILDNFKVYRFDGDVWVLMLEKTGNTNSTFDTTLANVVVTDKVYISSTRDIRNKLILNQVQLYGKTFVPPPTNGFTYTLGGSARTSAGVYDSGGNLIRTLWSGISKESGSYDYVWDGTKDDGSTASAGSYTAKVLSNNVTYTWEGVIGNTSTVQTGPTKMKAYAFYTGMAVYGTKAYFVADYAEGQSSCYVSNLSNVQIRDEVLPTTYPGPQDALYVCTDGTTVFWGGFDPYSPNGGQDSFVVGTKVSNNSQQSFSSGITYAPIHGFTYTGSVINRVNVINSAISGMAVQTFGNYLFVARKGLNSLYVLNRTSGALVQTLTYTNVRGLSITPDNASLWMITGTNTVTKYTINGDGTLTSTGTTLSGLTAPIATAISQDGATLIVSDGSTVQQVKGYNASTGGAASWTLGQSGGYASTPTVSNDRFMFTARTGWKEGGWLCFLSDGSFYVGDVGDHRAQHFSAARSYLDQLAFHPRLYNISVDLNNSTRVFGDYLEYAVDYTKSLSPTNGSWTLVKNWLYNVPTNQEEGFYVLPRVATLSNGRTYSFHYRRDLGGQPVEIIELTSSGLRFSGQTILNSYDIDKDGTLYRIQAITGGRKYTKRLLTGFDGSGNPTWGTETTLYQTTDPNTGIITDNSSGMATNINRITSSNKLIQWAAGTSNSYHLGAMPLGVNDNALVYQWKTAKAINSLFGSAYPTDGSYEIGNNVVNAGNKCHTFGRNVLWGYNGEFWNGGQTNKFTHVWDNGLLVYTFGQVRDYSQKAVAGMAGNSFSSQVIVSPTNSAEYYLYHNDESDHSGIHRWKISGLNTIAEQTFSITVP